MLAARIAGFVAGGKSRGSHSPAGGGARAFGRNMKNPERNPLPVAEVMPEQMNRLVALINAGRHTELEASARELLHRYPKSGVVWKILGLSLWQQGKNPLPALERVVELLPDDAEAHTNLGNMLRVRGRPEDA